MSASSAMSESMARRPPRQSPPAHLRRSLPPPRSTCAACRRNSGDFALSPDSSFWRRSSSLSLGPSSSSSESALRSSPMSSESSRSWTASPKRDWSSIRRSSRSSPRPALSSIIGRQRSTSFLAAGGGGCAGEALAHHHRYRVLDRRIGPVSNVVELAAMELVVQHRGEIFCDAGHAARADRLDARLLDRIEHRARLLPAGHEFAMHLRDRGRRA